MGREETYRRKFRPPTAEEETELKRDPLIQRALELGGEITGVSGKVLKSQSKESSSGSD